VFPLRTWCLGNLIGTDKSGTRALGNVDKGLVLPGQARRRTLWEARPQELPTSISANGRDGVEIASQGTSEMSYLET